MSYLVQVSARAVRALRLLLSDVHLPFPLASAYTLASAPAHNVTPAEARTPRATIWDTLFGFGDDHGIRARDHPTPVSRHCLPTGPGRACSLRRTTRPAQRAVYSCGRMARPGHRVQWRPQRAHAGAGPVGIAECQFPQRRLRNAGVLPLSRQSVDGTAPAHPWRVHQRRRIEADEHYQIGRAHVCSSDLISTTPSPERRCAAPIAPVC